MDTRMQDCPTPLSKAEPEAVTGEGVPLTSQSKARASLGSHQRNARKTAARP